MKLSLANRISIASVTLVALFGALSGYALYDKVRRSIKDDMEGRQNVRLAWIESCLEYDGDHLEMEMLREPSGPANMWQVATRDGRVLWSSPPNPKMAEIGRLSSETRRYDLGEKELPSVAGDQLTLKEDNGQNVYYFPSKGYQVPLLITARMPSAQQYGELARLQWALLTVIPIGTALLAVLITWYVRRQLRPLELVAKGASSIGPTNTDARLDINADAPEILQLRNAINEMIGRLAEGLDRERRFASVAAHELRTPLAQLRINLEVTLRRVRSGDEYRKYMGEALLDIERLQKLVVDLLELTRSQEFAISEKDKAVLDIVVAQAVRISGSPALLPSATETHVKGNEELLISAVRNVLDNARQYAPGEPPELVLIPENEKIRLQIMDSGSGIPEAERERIFLPLARLDTARSIVNSNDGLGLGLAISRAAVRAGGGELICRQRADGKQGACFEFTFERVSTTDV